LNRRKFFSLVGGAVFPGSLGARAQQPGIPTIGFLSLGGERDLQLQQVIEAFRSGLVALRYVEGKNIRVLYRFANGNIGDLSTLTVELVSLGVMIIVTHNTATIRAIHNAAPTVPIVSWAAADPVNMGWAQTLARPGGMITGVFQDEGTSGKRLELLKEALPQAAMFAYLLNASNPGKQRFRSDLLKASEALGTRLEIIELKEQSELPDAFARMRLLGVEGLAIIPDPIFGSDTVAATIAELARANRLAAVGDLKFSNAGGLFGFSEDWAAMARLSARFVDQILKGARPGDLAAEHARDYKVAINLKTAKALGLTVPPALLARADEIIE
jgi:putative ABC transport system substrate-binding protein